MVNFFNKKKSKVQTIISEKDRAFAMQILDDYEAAKAAKPVDEWIKYDKYIEDDQWGAAAIKDAWKPRPQVNICWKTLQSVHANLTSGRTSVLVTSRFPYYDDVVQKVAYTLEYYWDALDMDRKLSESEWIRPKLGAVCFKAYWDTSIKDLRTEVVHPANVFVDPAVTNPWELQSAEFIDVLSVRSIGYILRKYSKEGDSLCKYTRQQLMQLLRGENGFSDTEIYDNLSSTESTTVRQALGDTTKSTAIVNMRNRVNLHEYWYRDDNNTLQVAWLAGTVVLKCTEDDKEIKENGFYKHGRYPVVIIPYIQKDKRLWGRSELQSLIGKTSKRDGIQDIINVIVQDYLVNFKLVGQGQLGVMHGMVKDPSKLSGEAGLIIPTKTYPRQALYRLEGKPLTGAMEAVDAFLTHADRITNLWDVTQGRSTPYTKTAGGTLALLEQAMRPQNDKVNTLNYGLRELMELWLEHLAEFVKKPREYVRESGDNQQEIFEFNPSEILAAPKRVKDAGGNISESSTDTRKLYFNIKVDVGATLAVTRAYLVELAMNLFQNQAIDIEGLYRLLPDFPGKQDTLDRMKEMQQMQMEAEAAAQQASVPQEPQEPQVDPAAIEEFARSLPPEVLRFMVENMSPEEQAQTIIEMMQLSPEELDAYIAQMMGGAQDSIPEEQALPVVTG